MKIKLKNTPEQVELVKAMASKDNSVAREASEAFAAFIGPVVSKVLMQAGTASAIYTDAPYDEDDNPSIPLDLFYDQNQDHVTVWSQNVAGGLPTSTVEGFSELKISTYRLDSAVSFLKRYARRGRLDVVSKAVERMTNEVLVKQERNAWAVVLKALAEARTNAATEPAGFTNNNIAGAHVVNAAASGLNHGGSFKLAALNALMTKVKRLNTSYAGGTTADTYGLTDLFVSPEVKADIREFAFNPMRTDGSATNGNTTALPDSVREEIFRSAGTSELYGVTIHELVELGVAGKYSTLFDAVKGGHSFTLGTDELAIGLDLSKEAFIRPVARQSESGGTFTVLPDDQFVARSEKTGFYGSLEEGRVCIDARAIVGIRI
jgi:hypothetical protein